MMFPTTATPITDLFSASPPPNPASPPAVCDVIGEDVASSCARLPISSSNLTPRGVLSISNISDNWICGPGPNTRMNFSSDWVSSAPNHRNHSIPFSHYRGNPIPQTEFNQQRQRSLDDVVDDDVLSLRADPRYHGLGLGGGKYTHTTTATPTPTTHTLHLSPAAPARFCFSDDSDSNNDDGSVNNNTNNIFLPTFGRAYQGDEAMNTLSQMDRAGRGVEESSSSLISSGDTACSGFVVPRITYGRRATMLPPYIQEIQGLLGAAPLLRRKAACPHLQLPVSYFTTTTPQPSSLHEGEVLTTAMTLLTVSLLAGGGAIIVNPLLESIPSTSCTQLPILWPIFTRGGYSEEGRQEKCVHEKLWADTKRRHRDVDNNGIYSEHHQHCAATNHSSDLLPAPTSKEMKATKAVALHSKLTAWYRDAERAQKMALVVTGWMDECVVNLTQTDVSGLGLTLRTAQTRPPIKERKE
jgi:hypothetical protein